VKPDRVHPRRRNEDGELGQEVDGLEDHALSPVPPGPLQTKHHPPVRPALEAGLGQWRSQQVPGESFESVSIPGRYRLPGVEVESVSATTKIWNILARSSLSEELDDSLAPSRTQRQDTTEAGLAEISKPWLGLEQGVILAVIDIFLPEAAANQNIARSPARVPGNGGDLVVARRGKRLEVDGPIRALLDEDPVGDEAVKMHVQGEVTGAALDDRDGSGMGEGDGFEPECRLGFPPQIREDRPDEGCDHIRHERGIVGQEVPQWWREAQDPVPDRSVVEDAVGQKGGPIVHPSAEAAWAKAASLARKPDESVVAAVLAMHAGEPLAQDAAGQVLLERPLYEPGKRSSFLLAQTREGPVVLPDDLVQNTSLRAATLIGGADRDRDDVGHGNPP